MMPDKASQLLSDCNISNTNWLLISCAYMNRGVRNPLNHGIIWGFGEMINEYMIFDLGNYLGIVKI